MSVPQMLFIVVAVVAVALAFYAPKLERRRNEAEAARLRSERGLDIELSSTRPADIDFEHFLDGRNPWKSWVVTRASSTHSAFRFTRTVDLGVDDKEPTEFHSACALVPLPFDAPRTAIVAENIITRAAGALGARDVQTESAEFNKLYHVTSTDERFAITLLDQQMMGWLLSPASGRGSVSFELLGSWLLAWTSEKSMAELCDLFEWAEQLPTPLPDVLSSLYPVNSSSD